MFEQIGGLPLHPLVVHAVVVLVPLTTLGALLVAVRPRWARPYAPLVAAGAVASAGAALVAQQAGEALQVALALETPLLSDHGRWGLYTVVASVALAVLAVATTVLTFRGPGTGTAWRLAAWLTVVAGAAATLFAVLAGETGATSRWGFVFGG
ncbi:DUF2231 domain-containing protein [Aquipuribacter nitratireducens]|uniref:DUF2231 domain-containing protein n=1 Tax=Aquipuribacter nitratireducens TaxID=650104 RepID=A0ABW0GSE6_9MICO